MVGAVRTLKDIKSNKVRMYLRFVEESKQLKEELARATDEAKKRRATLTGGEWGAAQREAVEFGLDKDLV
jgi:hypothetical protein